MPFEDTDPSCSMELVCNQALLINVGRHRRCTGSASMELPICTIMKNAEVSATVKSLILRRSQWFMSQSP